MILHYIIQYNTTRRVVNNILVNSYYSGQLEIRSILFILSDLIVRKITLKKKPFILIYFKF